MTLQQAYDLLMVPYGASAAEVKRAYRHEALLVHPDRHCSSPPALRQRCEEKFKRLTEAYRLIREQACDKSGEDESQNRERPTQKREQKPKDAAGSSRERDRTERARSGRDNTRRDRVHIKREGAGQRSRGQGRSSREHMEGVSWMRSWLAQQQTVVADPVRRPSGQMSARFPSAAPKPSATFSEKRGRPGPVGRMERAKPVASAPRRRPAPHPSRLFAALLVLFSLFFTGAAPLSNRASGDAALGEILITSTGERFYRDADRSFMLPIPEGWVVWAAGGMVRGVVLKPQDEHRQSLPSPRMEVRIIPPLDEEGAATSWQQRIVEGFVRWGACDELSHGWRTLAGRPTPWVLLDRNSVQGTRRELHYALNAGEHVVCLSVTAPVEIYEQRQEWFRELTGRMRVLER